MAKRKWTNEELLNMLRMAHEKYGTITVRKLKEYGLPNQHVFIDYFGSFKNAINLSGIGIEPNKYRFFDRNPYTDEELLDLFKYYNSKKYKECGRYLTNDDIDEISDMPHSSTYCGRFGGILQVFDKIGIDYKDYMSKLDLEKKFDMLEKYMELYNKIGAVPTSRDLDKYAQYGGYSASTYHHHFESLYNICLILDLPISNSHYGNTSVAKDETVCLSNGELLIHNYLIENYDNIEKEIYYKDVVPNNYKELFGNMRMDWYFEHNNKKHIVEFFGMMGNKDYEIKHDKKLQLMNDINSDDIIFIKIYQKDIYELDDIFNEYI